MNVTNDDLLRLQAAAYQRHGRVDVYHEEGVGIVIVAEGRPITFENVLYAAMFTPFGIRIYEGMIRR